MVKIIVNIDCDNAPKKALIRDITIAFAKDDKSFILQHVDEDIKWEMIGEETTVGKRAFEEELDQLFNGTMEELIVDTIMSHGDVGAINGTMIFKDGTAFGFCDIYKFTSHSKDAKVESITSYDIELETQKKG